MELFGEAHTKWEVEQLYQDLASAKGKSLTNIEKLHLRGLLCGLSPCEIAQRRSRLPKSIEIDISKTLYSYIKKLTQRETKIESWRNVVHWLQSSYEKKPPISLSIPLQVQIENISALLVSNNMLPPPPQKPI